MGLFDFISGISPIGAILNPIGSIVSSAINADSQRKTNNANMEMNMQNLQFNKEEAEKSRQFNAHQVELQNQFNAEQAKLAFDRSSAFEREMWQKENEYNTPKAQIERLQSAGLNPNLFGGDNTASSVGVASSPAASGSPASGSSASAPSMIPMNAPLFNADFDFMSPILQSEMLKESIKEKRLSNRDKENELNAKERKEVNAYDDSYGSDVEERFENAYEENRSRGRYKHEKERVRSRVETQKMFDEYDLFVQTMPILIDMEKEKLNQLRADIKNKQLDNTLLEDEVELRTKYGISSRDQNILTALLRAAVRDPDNVERLLTNLIGGIKGGIKGTLIGNYGSTAEILKQLYPDIKE